MSRVKNTVNPVNRLLTINNQLGNAVNALIKAVQEPGFAQSVKTLQSEVKGDTCPVTLYLINSDKLHTAYYHPGAFGIEPTITLLAQKPEELVSNIQKIVNSLQ